MKALTLTQPYATLIAIGAKHIETRSWYTRYRGQLAIHAAKGYPKEAAQLCLVDPFMKVLSAAGFHSYGTWRKSMNDLPLGCVIATCDLVEVFTISPYLHHHKYPMPPPTPEYYFGDYTPARYAWILENIKPLPEPIPAKGALGLWEWNQP